MALIFLRLPLTSPYQHKMYHKNKIKTNKNENKKRNLFNYSPRNCSASIHNSILSFALQGAAKAGESATIGVDYNAGIISGFIR